MLDSETNRAIKEFGASVFESLGKDQPSAINRKFWAGRIMEWSMRHPDFKVNMFRLVDVLPALKSSKSVARHVDEYLANSNAQIGGIMSWGLRAHCGIPSWMSAFLVRRGVKEMASLFIAGQSPDEAVSKLQDLRKNKTAFTVDLLGEFCLSEKEAEAYLNRYLEALDVLGQAASKWPEKQAILANHPAERSPISISVKLTALYSQCSALNIERSVATLSTRLSQIVRKAASVGAGICVDAEDSANNPAIYKTFMNVFAADEFRNFPYPGIVVQAYAKDSAQTLETLLDFAKRRGSPIAVRLVKGAYWDQERAIASQNNWPMPLYVDKQETDANYEALSRRLLDQHSLCLSSFASHNIRSLSHVCCYAKKLGLTPNDFELQMLYGMAEPIGRVFSSKGYLVRFYVPLGDTLVGMGYLVRRLLENTSNESFLRHTFFEAADIENLLSEPTTSNSSSKEVQANV